MNYGANHAKAAVVIPAKKISPDLQTIASEFIRQIQGQVMDGWTELDRPASALKVEEGDGGVDGRVFVRLERISGLMAC